MSLFLDLSSFTGTYYYPDEIDTKLSYYDRQDISFGVRYQDENGVDVLLQQTVRDELLYSGLELDSLRISYAFDSYPLVTGFLYGRIGYVKRTGAFVRNSSLPHRERYLSGNYRFTGIYAGIDLSEQIGLQAGLGGNKYHNGIFTASLVRNSRSSYQSFFYIYTDKDDLLFTATHLIGNELAYAGSTFFVKNSLSLYCYPQRLDNNTLSNYSELSVRLTQQIITGGSFHYMSEQIDGDERRELTGYLRKETHKWQHTIYANNVVAGSHKTLSISPVLMYKFSASFMAGIETAFYNPQNSHHYYSAGIKVSYNDSFSF